MNYKRLLTILLILALALTFSPAQPAYAATITVETTNDVLDAAATCGAVSVASLPGADTFTSLREAICAANNNAGNDIIQFNITGCGGVCTIQPTTALPELTDDNTTINGYSQGLASPATETTPALILIEIDGRNVANNNGLSISSANNQVRGLAINRFGWNGIAIGGATATGNIVTGNHIGSDASGTMLFIGNKFDGVFIGLGAQNNMIGGDEPAERNIISGNELDGVGIHGGDTMSNTVSGNYIGADASGAVDMGNYWHGVHIYGGAKHNIVGGDTAGQRNVISENGQNGVYLAGGETMGNVILGNYIGTDYTGLIELGNFWDGVALTDGAHHNTIGPDNVISDNELTGIYLYGANTRENVITGNFIGPDHTGASGLGNRLAGVFIEGGAHNNNIGPDNIISGNSGGGVSISGAGTTSNTIAGNYIGLTADGTDPLINYGNGVDIRGGAQDNIVGGDSVNERNVISSNTGSGVFISGAGTNRNVVSGNYLNTNAEGTAPVRSFNSAVHIADGAQNNLIGGHTEGERNVIGGVGISSNPPAIWIEGAGTDNNFVSGNYIGTDPTGMVSLENYGTGVMIDEGAQNNVIGGTAAGAGNLISANGGSGIAIRDAGTNDNIVSGNTIGLASDGTTALGNVRDGVIIWDGADLNTIGSGNLIAHNGDNGVEVNGAATNRNTITQNSIFANTGIGIDLVDGANDGIIAPTITAVTSGSIHITGDSCPDCTVEVFANRDTEGEGEIYVGSAVADALGDFTLTVSYLPYLNLTSTSTNSSGTSEFSEVFTAELPMLTSSSMEVNPTTLAPGETLTYTITLTNTGTVAATATVSDTLPVESLTWADQFSLSNGTLAWDETNNRLVWNGTVNVGASETIAYQAIVNSDVVSGTVIVNTASMNDGAGTTRPIGPTMATVLDVSHDLYLPLVVR